MTYDDVPLLGPCCICLGEVGVTSIVMLPVRGLVPGHGWGCVTCGLSPEGAFAVLCEECTEDWQAGAQIRFACRGYLATDGRVPIEQLTEPHEHDLDQH
jgi:hypothetical protein